MVRLGLVDMVNSQKPCVSALAANLTAPVVAALNRHLEFLVEPRPVRDERATITPEVVVRSRAMRLDRTLHLSRAFSATEGVLAKNRWGSPDGLSTGFASAPEAIGNPSADSALPLEFTFAAAEVSSVLGDLRRLAGELLSAGLAGNSGVVVVPPASERVLGSQLGKALGSARRGSSSSQACLRVNVLAADRAGNYDMAPTKGVMTRRPTELMLVGFDSTGRTFERLAA